MEGVVLYALVMLRQATGHRNLSIEQLLAIAATINVKQVLAIAATKPSTYKEKRSVSGPISGGIVPVSKLSPRPLQDKRRRRAVSLYHQEYKNVKKKGGKAGKWWGLLWLAGASSSLAHNERRRESCQRLSGIEFERKFESRYLVVN